MSQIHFLCILVILFFTIPVMGDNNPHIGIMDESVDYIHANILSNPGSDSSYSAEIPSPSLKSGKRIDSGARFYYIIGPVRLHHPSDSSEENPPTLNSVIYLGDYVFTGDYGEAIIKTPGQFFFTVLPNSHILIGDESDANTGNKSVIEPEVISKSDTGSEVEKPSASVTQTGTETEGPVRIYLGEMDEISLSENPTTGFQWEVTVTKGLEIVSDSYRSESKEGMVGRGGMHIWTIRAVREGSQTFHAVYRRSWEPKTGNEKTYAKEYEVISDKNSQTGIQETFFPQPISTLHPQIEPSSQDQNTYSEQNAIIPMDTECEWNGIWDTSFQRMTLTQKGNVVEGNYEHDNGKISGIVEDNRLIGKWSEESDGIIDESGDLELTMSDDCTSFTGKWKHESEENWSGQWNGKRIIG